jgi:hypothetical protein
MHPHTLDQTNRAKLLIEKYKMNPFTMNEVDDRFGPVEWRLPEAHAIYWAFLGLQAAQQNPTKIKKDDLITLRRVIYQSMQLSFQRGRLVSNPYVKAFEFGPNLEIIPKVSQAYEQAAEEDKENHDHILRAHRNFLRDAVYFLYSNNRMKDADYWFKYLGSHYPDKMLIDGKTNSYPGKISLDDYAMSRIVEDVKETDPARITAIVEGMFVNHYMTLIKDDEEERALALKLLAGKIWNGYMKQIPQERTEAIGLAPLEDIQRRVLSRLLNTETGLIPEARAALRSRLGMPAETAAPPTPPASGTNNPASPASTP